MSRKTDAKSNSMPPGYSDVYDQYLRWVAVSPREVLFKRWGLLLLGATVLIVVAELVPLGLTAEMYVKAAIALPASVALFLVFLGIAHWRHVESGSVRMRDKYSPAKRRSMALIGLVAIIVAMLFSSSALPYALGGTIFLAVLFGLANFIRMTDIEKELEQNGIPDPRDVVEEVTPEEPDILDDDFSWEDYDDTEEEDYLSEEVDSDTETNPRRNTQ